MYALENISALFQDASFPSPAKQARFLETEVLEDEV